MPSFITSTTDRPAKYICECRVLPRLFRMTERGVEDTPLAIPLSRHGKMEAVR